MLVLVAGASGMIGAELCRQLEDAGHEPLRVVRRQPRTTAEFAWSPAGRVIDAGLMERADAVVNLSGASISRLPWTARYKRQILASRLDATHTLTDAMRLVSRPPRVFISGSAVGYYGNRPGERLTEESPKGRGFLSGVVEAWEAAARLAPESTRVVTIRTGVVVGRGGAMKPLLPLARLGLAGRIGSGEQNWPWISLHDEASAIVHLLDSAVSGPVNLVGSTPASASELLRELARQLHRPYGLLPLPAKAVELALRDAGDELLLASQQVVPQKLLDDGFGFAERTVRDAIARLLQR